MNAWDDLPNAHHIDWVLASVKAEPDKWSAARAAAWAAAWNAAWDAAWDAARDAARGAARDAARDAAWNALARGAARAAVMALVAYDHCGEYLSWPVKAVEGVAALGDPAAILLLPAVRVKNEVK